MRALSAVLLGLLALVAAAAYVFLKPPPEASGPIQAPALAQSQASSAVQLRRYEIDPSQSQARFVVDEILRGSPRTVVGSTQQVAGQVLVDPIAPGSAQLGPVQLNARTLATDSSQRDRAVHQFILQTADHEYIVFTPRQAVGLPQRADFGQPFSFQIVGDLAIRGTSREAIFETVVTPVSAERLEGNATTTIRYAEWGLTIPQVQSVTGVSEQVQLQLDFVARPA